MILMRILPGVLKELAKHVPTVLFQTVEWGELAHELPKISRRMIQKEGQEELFLQLKPKLLPLNIVLTQENLSHRSLMGNKEAGERILTLFFAQLYSPSGLFLDLRSTHFEYHNEALKWNPSPLWTSFAEDFRSGLLKVYEGFYLEEDDLYHQGLSEIGLLRLEWPLEEKKRLADLFREQFGKDIHSEQSFDVDRFKVSIVQMSEFMLKKKVKIPKDFLYLGVYLVGLYSTLEETGTKFPVKDIFLRVKKIFDL